MRRRHLVADPSGRAGWSGYALHLHLVPVRVRVADPGHRRRSSASGGRRSGERRCLRLRRGKAWWGVGGAGRIRRCGAPGACRSCGPTSALIGCPSGLTGFIRVGGCPVPGRLAAHCSTSMRATLPTGCWTPDVAMSRGRSMRCAGRAHHDGRAVEAVPDGDRRLREARLGGPGGCGRRRVAPWTELPIWLPPTGEFAGLHDGVVSAAYSAGLTCRPVAETVADTWAWLQGEGLPAQRTRNGLRWGWTRLPRPGYSRNSDLSDGRRA